MSSEKSSAPLKQEEEEIVRDWICRHGFDKEQGFLKESWKSVAKITIVNQVPINMQILIEVVIYLLDSQTHTLVHICINAKKSNPHTNTDFGYKLVNSSHLHFAYYITESSTQSMLTSYNKPVNR